MGCFLFTNLVVFLVLTCDAAGRGVGGRLRGGVFAGPASAGRGGALPAAAMALWLPTTAEDSGSPIEARLGKLTVRACTAAGPLSNRNTFSCSRKITA
jgi:hypothetical protein